MRPNPPRLVTVALAVVLLVVGLSATIVPISIVNEALAALPGMIGIDFTMTTQVGWICLLLANVVLALGSLVRGL